MPFIWTHPKIQLLFNGMRLPKAHNCALWKTKKTRFKYVNFLKCENRLWENMHMTSECSCYISKDIHLRYTQNKQPSSHTQNLLQQLEQKMSLPKKNCFILKLSAHLTKGQNKKLIIYCESLFWIDYHPNSAESVKIIESVLFN